MSPEQAEAQKWLAELIYQISHLSLREDLYDDGKEYYRPIIPCSKVDAARNALAALTKSN